jgi:hypothetical protein
VLVVDAPADAGWIKPIGLVCTLWLAQRHYEPVLVDLTPLYVDIELDKVVVAHVADALDVPLDDEALDAALLLGPLFLRKVDVLQTIRLVRKSQVATRNYAACQKVTRAWRSYLNRQARTRTRMRSSCVSGANGTPIVVCGPHPAYPRWRQVGHTRTMSIGDDDPADVAPISSDHLITDLELDQEFEVYAIRVVVDHRTAGRIELWREDGTNLWKVVRPGGPYTTVLNWTTGRFEDSLRHTGDNVHRYLMP